MNNIMPDIIEETGADGAEGDGNVIAQRQAAAAAAVAGNAGAAENNNNNQAMSSMDVARQMHRLVGVDVRPLFTRLGVRRAHDIAFLRERDFDSLNRLSVIQKRKLWALTRFVATKTNTPITSTTTMEDVLQALSDSNKKKNREAGTSASTSTTSSAPTNLPVANVLHQGIREFDGSYHSWLSWKNATRYSLFQTMLGALIYGPKADAFCKKHPCKDFLLFNILSEALARGDAKHLARQVEREATSANEKNNSSNSKEAAKSSTNGDSKKNGTNDKKSSRVIRPSGRKLWNLLQQEYMEGPMACLILSQARDMIQNKYLEENSSTSQLMKYISAIRQAKDSLEEYQQALPDAFVASTLLDHIMDDRFDSTKARLRQELTTKNMSFETVVKEILMADHVASSTASNKRVHVNDDDSGEDSLTPGHGRPKRLKMEEA